LQSLNDQPKDLHGRTLRDLRLSLTDQCNLRCRYCMPREVFGPDYAFLPESQYLDFEQLTRLVIATRPLGLEKVRLTGGEPLLRKNVHELVRMLKNQAEINDVALTTNGLLLGAQAPRLAEAGLDRINVSLDALDPEVYREMSGGYGSPKAVTRGIQAALERGMKVKVNSVVKRGVNESQIPDLIAFGIETGVEVRFIEYMDVGATNEWKRGEVVSAEEILDWVSTRFEWNQMQQDLLKGVARMYAIPSCGYAFGIISSITNPFCSSCTRARVSSDGKLFTCLFSENGYDLKPWLEPSVDPEWLTDGIRSIWMRRDDQYSLLREQLDTASRKVEMSFIGG